MLARVTVGRFALPRLLLSVEAQVAPEDIDPAFGPDEARAHAAEAGRVNPPVGVVDDQAVRVLEDGRVEVRDVALLVVGFDHVGAPDGVGGQGVGLRHPPHQVELVYRLLEHPVAGEPAVVEPAPQAGPAVVAMEAALDQVADLALLDLLDRLGAGRAAAPLEADLHHDVTVGRARVLDPLHALRGDRHRLLAVEVHPRLKGIHVHPRVPEAGRRHDEAVECVGIEQLAVLVRLGPEGLWPFALRLLDQIAPAVQVAGRSIADADHINILEAEHALEQPGSPPADTNEPAT